MKEIIKGKGTLRQIAMELLHKVGGLKGAEIGNVLEIDYSPVSIGRKRLREKLDRDKKLSALVERIENNL